MSFVLAIIVIFILLFVAAGLILSGSSGIHANSWYYLEEEEKQTKPELDH
jgi:hypothetical protein